MGGSWRHIAGELYRGSYRSRSPERQGQGGSWRYIAGELYRGSHRSRSHERPVAWRQLAVYSRGGAEEDAGGRRKEERTGENLEI